MRLLPLLSILSLVCALPVHAGKLERLTERLVTHISADVTVDATGQLASIGELSVDLDPTMRELVLAEMRAARFEPGKINGEPAEVRTGLTVTLGLRDGAAPGEFLLELVDVGTGPSMVRSRPPRYPAALLAAGREARAMTRLRYDAQGKVVEATILSSTVPEKYLRHEILAAARRWRFEPEQVGGHGLPGEAFVPVWFTLSDRSVATYTVRLKSGSRLKFQPETPVEDREEFASALEVRFEAGRLLDMATAGG